LIDMEHLSGTIIIHKYCLIDIITLLIRFKNGYSVNINLLK
jgi:hypothetical protein